MTYRHAKLLRIARHVRGHVLWNIIETHLTHHQKLFKDDVILNQCDECRIVRHKESHFPIPSQNKKRNDNLQSFHHESPKETAKLPSRGNTTRTQMSNLSMKMRQLFCTRIPSFFVSIMALSLYCCVVDVSAHGHVTQPVIREININGLNGPVASEEYVERTDADLVALGIPKANLVSGQSIAMKWVMPNPHNGDCAVYYEPDPNTDTANRVAIPLAYYEDCNQKIESGITVPILQGWSPSPSPSHPHLHLHPHSQPHLHPHPQPPISISIPIPQLHLHYHVHVHVHLFSLCQSLLVICPSGLPSCNSCILRWEWKSPQWVNTIEVTMAHDEQYPVLQYDAYNIQQREHIG